MTKNQKILFNAIVCVKNAQHTIIDAMEVIEDTIGDGTPLYKKLEYANDCVDFMTEFAYEFFGNDMHDVSDEAKENFFYWINNDKYNV